MAEDTAPRDDELGGRSGTTPGSRERWLDQVTFRVAMLAARPTLRKGRVEIAFPIRSAAERERIRADLELYPRDDHQA